MIPVFLEISMHRQSLAAFLFAFLATALPSLGACHAVGPTPTGNGSGSDWSNRAALPTTLVRGDTYYLMDGNYGNYHFSTANSGTTRVTVKKAQNYDYGRTSDGCPNDISAGWNAATMGNAQAVFSNFSAGSAVGYITIDGNGQDTTNPGCGTSQTTHTAASDCGIKVVDSKGSIGAFNPIGSYNNFNSPSNGWTIRYTEVQGAGDSNTSVEEDTLWCRDGCNDLKVEHSYWYNTACVFVKLPHSTGATFTYNVFKQNYSSSTCHGQMYMDEGDTSNITFADNIIQDIQGTAVWTFNTGAHASNYLIYNNVLVRTQGSSRPGTSNGILACINAGSTCTNIKFIGNSVVNYTADYPGALGIRDENGNGSYVWQNNLFYDIPADRIAFSLGPGTTLTEDHNSWLDSGSPRNGADDITVTSGAPNPFVDWPSGDFRLANQNSDWGNGATLAAPLNVDMAGSQRPGSDGTWNRGAYEYGGSQLAAPSNLKASVQ